MRLVVLALSLPYPHPSPDMEPDASNTIMVFSANRRTAEGFKN